jgi:aerobic-type carbon monoxide dehydrogenase small subunit (CoxS/CutS family)
MQLELVVNDAPVTLEAEPLATAVEVLRGLGLFSVRETCALGVCGTCTILLDGTGVSACLTPAFRLDGASVTTVEGLAEGLHPVQQAFIDEHAFQCSFCTPGFVLGAKVLLDAVTEVRRADVEAYLGGHLCRCGSYENIVRAVKRAALAAGKTWLAD